MSLNADQELAVRKMLREEHQRSRFIDFAWNGLVLAMLLPVGNCAISSRIAAAEMRAESSATEKATTQAVLAREAAESAAVKAADSARNELESDRSKWEATFNALLQVASTASAKATDSASSARSAGVEAEAVLLSVNEVLAGARETSGLAESNLTRLQSELSSAQEKIGQLQQDTETCARNSEKASNRASTAAEQTEKLLEDVQRILTVDADGNTTDLASAILESEAWTQATARVQGVPIGAIIAWLSDDLPEAGEWRICNGAYLPLDQYPELARILPERALGGGEIVLPNFSGMFLRGIDLTSGIDPSGTRPPGDVQLDSFGQHTHEVLIHDPGHSHGFSALQVGSRAAVAHGTDAVGYPEAHRVTASTKSRITATAASMGGQETRPVNSAVYWIIRVR